MSGPFTEDPRPGSRANEVAAKLVRLTDRDTLWVLSRLALANPERVEQAIGALVEQAHEQADVSHSAVTSRHITARNVTADETAEPMSAQCRDGRHPTLLGDEPCDGDCVCWCHAGQALRPIRWSDLEPPESP